jgi:hypothetical protein
MPDYQKGKIYKIVSDNIEGTYYGSTADTLWSRFGKHNKDFRAWKKGSKKYYTSYKLIEAGNASIVLVEYFPCNSKIELKARERWYIENNDCVNKNIPNRTMKEYYQDNKEKIKEHNKEYYQDNKEKIKEQKKEYYQDNKDKLKEHRKEYYQDNNEKIKEYNKEYYQDNKEKMKEYYQDNKEKIKEYQKLTFQCLCDGEQHRLYQKQRHFRSQYHITNLKAICDIHGVNPNDL